MTGLRTQLRKATRVALLLYVAALIPGAFANPITATFTVVNSNADGFVVMPSILFPGDISSFDLTGGNNGSGLEGETDFVGTAPSAGLVQFQWSYTSCFPANQQPPSAACDSPGFDWTGYLIGQTLTQLTDTDTAGLTSSASFMVSAGAEFGWYVGTADNMGEPGTVAVSNISFTPSTTGAGAPEPGTLLLCAAGIATFLAARRTTMRIQAGKGRNI
jgi:hypothetical protein